MKNPYFIKRNYDDIPILFRRFQGANADSMKGDEVIARGEEDILNLFGAIVGWSLNEKDNTPIRCKI